MVKKQGFQSTGWITGKGNVKVQGSCRHAVHQSVGTQALGHRVKYIGGEVIERCGLVKSSAGLCSWCHLQALKLQ